MSNMTALRALMMSCLWMTSQAVLSVLKLKTFHGAAEVMIGYEMRVMARSALHCVILCKTYPHCISAAYDAETSWCFLHPQTTTSAARFSKLQSSNHSQVLIFTDINPDCNERSFNATYESLTSRRSLWSVEGNVTCNDCYPLFVPVTCLSDGSWTPPNPAFKKRIWRYPETKMISNSTEIIFPIPWTVTKGWSLCVDGIPTAQNRFIVEIHNGSAQNIPIHTSWWFAKQLTVNDMVNGAFGHNVDVTNPPLLLVVGTPFFVKLTAYNGTTIDVYLNNIFFNRWSLRFPLYAFTDVSVQYDVNISKVEMGC